MPAHDHPPLAAEFEALYDEHFAFVWRALRAFGVPAQSLDDATQDVFLVVHRRFGTWGDASSIRAWLWGVARRVASARRRTDERHRRKLEALPRPDDPRSLEGRADARHRLERIAEAIDSLAPRRREVYVLAELEGLRPPEIAGLLGCKLNTVYSRLRRAREDLSAALVRAGLDDAHPPQRHASPLLADATRGHGRSHARAR